MLKRILQTGFAVAGISVLLTLIPWQAAAGMIEFSIGGSFSQSQYTDASYNWTRRIGGSFGYHFTDTSEIEVALQDVFDRTVIDDSNETSLSDRIYSVNWVQGLTAKTFPIQPYLKAGIGQLNRDLSGTIGGKTIVNSAGEPVVRYDSLTGIIGGGLRIYFTKKIALRAEATSYLSGGKISTWKQNTATQIGLSFYF